MSDVLQLVPCPSCGKKAQKIIGNFAVVGVAQEATGDGPAPWEDDGADDGDDATGDGRGRCRRPYPSWPQPRPWRPLALKLASLGPHRTATPRRSSAAPLRPAAASSSRSLYRSLRSTQPQPVHPSLVCCASAACGRFVFALALSLASLDPTPARPPVAGLLRLCGLRPLRLRARLELAALGPPARPHPRSSAAPLQPAAASPPRSLRARCARTCAYAREYGSAVGSGARGTYAARLPWL